MKKLSISLLMIPLTIMSIISLSSCEKSGKKIRFDVYGGKFDYKINMNSLIEDLGKEYKLYIFDEKFYDFDGTKNYSYERYEYKNVYKNQNGIKSKEINEFEDIEKFDISNLMLYSFSKTYELNKSDDFNDLHEFEEEIQYEIIDKTPRKYNLSNDTYETKYNYSYPKTVKLKNVKYEYDIIYDDYVKYYKDNKIYTIHIEVEDLVLKNTKKDSNNGYITFIDTIDYEYLFQFYNANSTRFYKFYEYKNVITEYDYNGIKMKNEETSIFKAYEKFETNSNFNLKRCKESKYKEIQ